MARILFNFECQFRASVETGILAGILINFEFQFRASVETGIFAGILINFECQFRASVGTGILAGILILSVNLGLPYRTLSLVVRISSGIHKLLKEFYIAI